MHVSIRLLRFSSSSTNGFTDLFFQNKAAGNGTSRQAFLHACYCAHTLLRAEFNALKNIVLAVTYLPCGH